ncbi:hypothetical protein T484DRAFT_1846198 [Baffinella frigidus]|nr:hypothetical protein T484DRAFT_1846198 [Cryptophyta sp. CCMP2293]
MQAPIVGGRNPTWSRGPAKALAASAAVFAVGAIVLVALLADAPDAPQGKHVERLSSFVGLCGQLGAAPCDAASVGHLRQVVRKLSTRLDDLRSLSQQWGDHVKRATTSAQDAISGMDNDAGVATVDQDALNTFLDRAGPPGHDGSPGPRGPHGMNGRPGPVGHMGHIGLPGIHGYQGVRGSQGPLGISGETGPAGSQGPMGIWGTMGATGVEGIPGDNLTAWALVANLALF